MTAIADIKALARALDSVGKSAFMSPADIAELNEGRALAHDVIRELRSSEIKMLVQAAFSRMKTAPMLTGFIQVIEAELRKGGNE